MLDREQLDALDIAPTALELIPEAVAREYRVLAVSLVEDSLHLIVPTSARDLITSEGDTIDRLRFILNRDFTFDMADPDDLLPVVDIHYRAVYSDIRNCDPKFSINCPKQWSELSSTGRPLIRFCNRCNRSVHFCLTSDELTKRTADNQCVAFCSSETQSVMLGLLEFPEN
ncbi:MAG: hypothetical protein Aurels2KO_52010 [Aureliella sp.]